MVTDAIDIDKTEYVTIRNINFSKKHSKYLLAMHEKKEKIRLDQSDMKILQENFGTYMGEWRQKRIKIDEEFNILGV